jgi:hypothetical protein
MRKNRIKCVCPTCGNADYFDEDEVNDDEPVLCSVCYAPMRPERVRHRYRQAL